MALETTVFPSVPTSPAADHKAVYFALRAANGGLEVRFGPERELVATIEPAPGREGGLDWLGDCALGEHYSVYAVCSGLLVEPAEGREPPDVRLDDPSWHTMRSGRRIALVHTDGAGPSLLGLDTGTIESIARTWIDSGAAPGSAAEFEPLLRHARILHRVSMYGPQGIFPHPWSTPCRASEYQRPMIAMWDTLHIVLDLLAMGEGELAVRELLNHYAQQHPDTGQMPQDSVASAGDLADGFAGAGRDAGGRNFRISQPPLWAPVSLEVADRLGDDKLLEAVYPLVEANLGWWEANRQDPETGLFFWANRYESGCDNTPRFGAAAPGSLTDETIGPRETVGYGAADLSAQMHLSYEAAGRIAERLGLDASRWAAEAEPLAGAMNGLLWSDEAGMYLDYDVGLDEPVGPRTAMGFFPLVTSVPGPERAQRMVEALTDGVSFWRELPVPTVAVDEESCSGDMWRGPVWLSINLWIARGLARWGRADIASELARRSLRRAQAVLEREGAILEFYPPDGMRLAALRRKGSVDGPHRHYIGHAPLHALAELLGER